MFAKAHLSLSFGGQEGSAVDLAHLVPDFRLVPSSTGNKDLITGLIRCLNALDNPVLPAPDARIHPIPDFIQCLFSQDSGTFGYRISCLKVPDRE
jgi:hypothetical protein